MLRFRFSMWLGEKRRAWSVGDKKERGARLAMVAVVAAAIAAACLSLVGVLGSGRERPDGWFHCQKCDHEWSVPNEVSRALTAGSPFVDCPECEAKNAAAPMGTCPACGERYLSRPPKVVRKCPNCGTDIPQWYEDHPL